jgi:hypothetical protein
MNYNYETQKPELFTKDGLRLVVNALANAIRIIQENGVATRLKIATLDGVGAADGWTLIAVCDYLVEIGYLKHVGRNGNDDIFVGGPQMRRE